MATVVSPIILDETGQDIAQKLDAIREAVQPTNACLDIDISLPTSGWSGSGPYTYTYSNTHVTSGCSVKVNFLESNSSGGVLCLDYEKVTGGVRFTSSSVPNAAIPVRIHVLNADATSTMATTADLVSTDAISGTSNVQDALESVGQSIGTLNTQFTNRVPTVTGDGAQDIPSNADLNSYGTGGVYIVRSDSIASTISNMPRSASGRLIVIPEFSDGGNYVFQYYMPSTSFLNIYVRKYASSWTEWAQLANVKSKEISTTTTGGGNVDTGLNVSTTVILSAMVISRSDTVALPSTWSGQGANASWGLNIRNSSSSGDACVSTSITVRIYYIDFYPI